MTSRLINTIGPFLKELAIRIVATVIAPTPLLASNFIILGMLIRHLGERYSRLGPKLCERYGSVFISYYCFTHKDTDSIVFTSAVSGYFKAATDC